MRRDYIDWLRNLAILFLFPYHTARIFDQAEAYYVEGEPGWITTSLIHASFWFMPLLFLVAGMASHFGLQRRSGAFYLKERLLRLFVPLLAGLVLVVPAQAWIGGMFHGRPQVGYLEFLGGYFTDWSELSGYFGTFTPGQLWFIAFLFVISVALLPAMTALKRAGFSLAAPRHPVFLLVPSLGLASLAALPDVSGKNVFLYAGYFFAGYLLATNDGIVELVSGRRRVFLGIAVMGIAAILTEHYTIGWQSGFSAAGVGFTLWHHLVYWATLLAILGYGRRYLDRPSRLMRYLNGAAYPIFIVHQTFIVLIGYVVLDTDGLETVGQPVLQYALIMTLSLAASIASYEVIRRVGVLRLLFGVKKGTAAAADAAVSAVLSPDAVPSTSTTGARQ